MLLVNVPGEYIEEERHYVYSAHRKEDLNTFIGPSFDSEITGQIIKPGTVIIVSAIFTAEAEAGAAEATSPPRITFAKLLKDKSWVACTDVDTGEQLLELK